MTESEWLESTEPLDLLKGCQGRASNRKSRLFACASCRLIWSSLADPRSQRAIEISEQVADGLLDEMELRAAQEEAMAAVRMAEAIANEAHAKWAEVERKAANAAASAAAPLAADAARDVLSWVEDAVMTVRPWKTVGPGLTGLTIEREDLQRLREENRKLWIAHRSAQSDLLRDIFDNPFRPRSIIDPVLREWNNGLVVWLAQAAYEQLSLPSGTLDNTRLAVLADALLDAGCTDTELMTHLRSPGSHVRGCHALDLILATDR